MEKLKIEYIDVDKLTPYEKNTRKHEKFDVDVIAKSIEKYGFDDPIGIWGDKNTVVEGHGRLLAAKQLGMDKVPCIRLDHLTNEQRREYAIMHNKSAEQSDWDFDLLSEELADLDLDDFGLNWGIDQDEIDAEEKASEDEGKAAVDTLTDSRVLGFSLSAFGTASECFLEIIIPQEESEKLIKYIRENGSEKILEQIRGVIESV